MSYSKDHSRKNPLAPSRMYGMNSSANTNTTPIGNQPTVTTERVARDGQIGILETTKKKPRKSKLPLVGMEEAYDRALKLGYRDENETLEDFTIRANKFNEGEVTEEFTPEMNLMKARGIKPIDSPESNLRIQTVPFINEIPEEEVFETPEEGDDEIPETPKEKIPFKLPFKLKGPKINFNLRNKKPKPKILKKGGFMKAKKSQRRKTKRKFSGRRGR